MVDKTIGEQAVMRIFVNEGDKFHHVLVYEALVELFRKEGFAGASVLRGIAGFGPHNGHRTDRLQRLSSDVPVVVELVDDRQRLDAVMPKVEEIIDGGMITIEKVSVWRYPRRRDA